MHLAPTPVAALLSSCQHPGRHAAFGPVAKTTIAPETSCLPYSWPAVLTWPMRSGRCRSRCCRAATGPGTRRVEQAAADRRDPVAGPTGVSWRDVPARYGQSVYRLLRRLAARWHLAADSNRDAARADAAGL